MRPSRQAILARDVEAYDKLRASRALVPPPLPEASKRQLSAGAIAARRENAVSYAYVRSLTEIEYDDEID